MKILMLVSLTCLLMVGCTEDESYDRELKDGDLDLVWQDGEIKMRCKLGERLKHSDGSIWVTDRWEPGNCSSTQVVKPKEAR